MPLIVQKFGGTSVADSEKILAAARKAIRAQREGNQVVMVVSAMGKNTDALVELAAEISDHPPDREMDMLLATGEQVSVALMSMAVDRLGHQAISFTGAQVGIRTDNIHTQARIQSISTERMQRALDEGKIVIVAGFQGIDADYNITTLGRGGSDTTAVALAAVMNAALCEVHTDVDGVYTTDPRLAPEACMLRQVSYDEMLELASLGAGVMHSRAIEFAKKFNVPIHVRSSFSDTPGTMIVEAPEPSNRPVSGCAVIKDEALVTLTGVPDQPGTSLAVFSKIASRNVTVDMIVQNIGEHGKADISFTVLRNDLPVTLAAVEEAARELDAEGFYHEDTVGKVSVVGLGMALQSGVASRMFHALADSGINMLMITTSEIKISALVAREYAEAALRIVHRTFGLEKAPEAATTTTSTQQTGNAPQGEVARHAIDVVKRLQAMEALAIDEIVLDESQARVTLSDVPDHPGIAASVFDAIGAAGIFVDMIVQSYARGGRATISFTVPRDTLQKSEKLARRLSAKLGCGPVSSAPGVAKLSVTGIGMRSHAEVAIRMFEALARAGINVGIISTSEVRVNVVVGGDQGAAGLKALQQAFAEAQG